jgi:putative exporter of polyketide antibiotics
MQGMRKVITTTGLLGLALLPIIGAVSPDAAPPPNTASSRMPVAIAQPLAAMDGGALVPMPSSSVGKAMLPESGMLVLVGSALMGLAAVVRRTTKNS